MDVRKSPTKTVFFPAFVLACFIVGRMIPTFYDWTDADQSYSTPAADQAFWSLISFGVLAWFVIPCLPMKEASTKKAPAQSEPKRFQFNLYSLMVLTAIIAILLALVDNQSVVICILLWMGAFVSAVWMIVKHLSWKWQFSAMLACMYFPYAWVISYDMYKKQNGELVLGAVGLPALLPSLAVGSITQTRTIDEVWLWVFLTVIEAAIGFCLIITAPKCTIAYFVLVVLVSTCGSIFLNIGMRI